MSDGTKLDKMISNAEAVITALALTRTRGVTKNHINLIIFNAIHNLGVLINDLKELKNEAKEN